MEIALLSSYGVEFLFRWIHFLAGITWIGLLYYFNLVQGEWFKEIPGDIKSAAIQKLVPRALWWFRWGAVFTLLSGLFILMQRAHLGGMELLTSNWGVLILMGGILGTLMFLNVWLVIWPNQKIVIAGKPEAPGAAARAGLASRTNFMLSIPMLFFMGAASHLGLNVLPDSNLKAVWVGFGVIVAAIQLNAVRGKLGPLASIKGAIMSGVALTAVLYGLVEYFL